MRKLNIVFMSSTLHRDPQTQKSIKAILESGLNVKISLIIGEKEKEDALSAKWAKEQGIPIVFIETKGKTIEETDEKIILEIKKHGRADCVFLVGWMKFLGSAFLKKFENKALNIHPSKLPKFAGLMDWEVHKAVLAAHETESGCTLHFVDKTIDGGLIVIQRTVPVYPLDTAATLRERVQTEEIKVILEAVQLLVENRIKVEGKEVIILSKPQIIV